MDAIVQKRPAVDLESSTTQRYIVDQRFVAGYFDVDRDVFCPNPHFDPTFNKELLESNPDLYKIMGKLTMNELYPGDDGNGKPPVIVKAYEGLDDDIW